MSRAVIALFPSYAQKKALNNMDHGQVLKVLTDDPAADIDFMVFAEESRNELLAIEHSGNSYIVVIRKTAVRRFIVTKDSRPRP